jgi:hypothetical protein
MKTTSYDLKILKVEYLINHFWDHTQFLNLDDRKILKVDYLRNHLLDPTQILNLCLYDQTIMY